MLLVMCEGDIGMLLILEIIKGVICDLSRGHGDIVNMEK